jgi:hypothetical protein
MSVLNMLAVTAGGPASGKLAEKAGFKCEGVIPVPGDLASIVEAVPGA